VRTRGDPTVHGRGELDGKVTGRLGGFAGHPGPDLTSQYAGPQPREPVSEVQRIGDQPGRAERGHGKLRTQLGRRELRHLRSALAAKADQALHPRQRRAVR
jgi:hypothetical protein